MDIRFIHSVLVPPMRNRDTQTLMGTDVPMEGELYRLISEVFQNSVRECNIPIAFCSDNQNNETRNDILALFRNPCVDEAVSLFTRLALVTSGVSGTALCFSIVGQINGNEVLFLARFPASEGLRTQITKDQFQVEVVDIFLKSSKAYKAALYRDSSLESGFWTGMAVDKQVSEQGKDLSEYWIRDFLQSELLMTSKSGTAMISKTLRKAMDGSKDLQGKQQLINLSTLLPNFDGQHISMGDVCRRLAVPVEVREVLKANLEHPRLFDEVFEFSLDEYSKHSVFRSVYLDQGAILTAASSNFDECFNAEIVNSDENISRYSTTGKVIDIKVRKRV